MQTTEALICQRCQAPLHGPVCEYCGTEHRIAPESKTGDVLQAYYGGYATANDVRESIGLDASHSGDYTAKTYRNMQGQIVHQDLISHEKEQRDASGRERLRAGQQN